MKKLALILCLGLSFSLFAAIPSNFYGTCTKSGEFCAYFSPTDMPILSFAQYLQNAKRSIKIAIYNMGVKELIPVIQDRLNNGVKVEIVTDFKLSFSSNKVSNALQSHPNLTKYRIPVLRGGNPQMHNKILIIDDETLLIGSANFTYFGLLANFENVMAIKNKYAIEKFSAEFNELRQIAYESCRLFSGSNCKNGGDYWDRDFSQFATSGKVPTSAIASDAPSKCSNLVNGKGFLNEGNLPIFKGAESCFKDARYAQLADFIKKTERYVDGTLVADKPPYYDYKTKTSYRYHPEQNGKMKVFFSPEDDVQYAIVNELEKTLENPMNSFAYISTNFITNRTIANTLVKMQKAGVRMRIFFDRGRYEDPNFSSSISTLNELGFTWGGDNVSDNDQITIFNNTLTSGYGCNHNKMSVVYTPREGARLLNGSANWSVGAMNRNDENLTITYDEELAAIYMKEIISELFIYRYGQNINHQGFREDINFVYRRLPQLANALWDKKDEWNPRNQATAIISMEKAPVNETNGKVWIWVYDEQTKKQVVIPMFSDDNFAGKWLATIPASLGANIRFKFFASPIHYDAFRYGPYNSGWEYSSHNDRTLTLPKASVALIEKNYEWGNPF